MGEGSVELRSSTTRYCDLHRLKYVEVLCCGWLPPLPHRLEQCRTTINLGIPRRSMYAIYAYIDPHTTPTDRHILAVPWSVWDIGPPYVQAIFRGQVALVTWTPHLRHWLIGISEVARPGGRWGPPNLGTGKVRAFGLLPGAVARWRTKHNGRA